MTDVVWWGVETASLAGAMAAYSVWTRHNEARLFDVRPGTAGALVATLLWWRVFDRPLIAVVSGIGLPPHGEWPLGVFGVVLVGVLILGPY